MEQRVVVDYDRGPGDSCQLKFKLEGFEGSECTSLEELENMQGTVTERKPTDEAFVNEIPVPVPNQVRSGQ